MPAAAHGLHLALKERNAEEIQALIGAKGTERVGVQGVLDHLNRQARQARIPGRAPVHGFTWNTQDDQSETWWPQGITTSADASDHGTVGGHQLVLTSWYSKRPKPDTEGSRITIVDIGSLRYRHVLVVRAGPKGMEPLPIHAGGLLWYGDYLHLAGTARGLFTCHVDDIIRVDPSPTTYDYRYLLPVRYEYAARTAKDQQKLRYSFMSVDRAASPPQLVAGEYGVEGQTTRLVRYPIDPESHLLHMDEESRAMPDDLDEKGVGHMQGVAMVGGRYYVTVSRGRFRMGHLYVGRPGALRPHRWALPPGPEDISYWPQRDQLWSLSEYPGRRYVFAMDRQRLRRFPALSGLLPALRS